ARSSTASSPRLPRATERAASSSSAATTADALARPRLGAACLPLSDEPRGPHVADPQDRDYDAHRLGGSPCGRDLPTAPEDRYVSNYFSQTSPAPGREGSAPPPPPSTGETQPSHKDTGQPAGKGDGGCFGSMLPMLLVPILLLFLMTRSQSKKQR